MPGALPRQVAALSTALGTEGQPKPAEDPADEVRARIRKEVAEENKRAQSTWKEAESALSKVLKAPEHRESRSLDLRGSLPLLRNSILKRASDAWSTCTSEEDYDTTRGSSDNSPAHITDGPTDAFGKRARLLRVRAAETTERLANHAKRRLRAKIADVLREVRKRQELQKQQDKARRFKEQRFAEGRGPDADLGHARSAALDLTRLDAVKEQAVATSPRRTSLLNALTVPELDMVRRSPHFFFSGSAVYAAVGCSQMPSSPRASSSPRKAPTSDQVSAEGQAALDELINFFHCSHAERNLDVHQYLRTIRARLIAKAEAEELALKMEAESSNLRQKMCRSQPSAAQLVADGRGSHVDSESPMEPLELMPCLGRHPLIIGDEASPTLQRVRQAYNRRDAADARWVEEKREAIDRRLALNAFKAREQQREIQLQVHRQKELHKIRQLETEVRKNIIDAEEHQRNEIIRVQKDYQVDYARDLAVRAIEDKRDVATHRLEVWHKGTVRARKLFRKEEVKRQAEGVRHAQQYMARLHGIGEGKHNLGLNQAQKNDKLKEQIHRSLYQQMKAQKEEDNERKSMAINSKLEAAAHRRKQVLVGSRYDFTERAFGAEAVGFDAKHHSLATDRRKASWKDAAQAWSVEQHSFSLPDLRPASRLWTAEGSTSEQEFVERSEKLDFSLA